jgi:uncharacterized protein (DUF58 family)
MRYGEGAENKLEYAKLLTACLAYVVIRQRDSMALNVFDNAWREQLPASSNMTQITTLLHTLEALKPREKTNMGPLLEQLADRVRRRGLVFVVSDCFDDVQALLKGLRHLRFQGHDVTVFHVMHPDETDFPFTGNTKFDGLEMPEEIKTRPHLIRPAYLKAVLEYLEQLRKGCDAFRVDYVPINTTKPLTEALTPYLVKRLQMGRL